MSYPQIDAAIQKVFCNPPIMAGEDPADYRGLTDAVIAHVRPQDLQEVLLTRDIVDAEWEYRRLRGLKPGIVHAAFPRAVKSQIADPEEELAFDKTSIPAAIRKHVSGMVAGDAQARPELERMLEHHQLTVDIIAASAFVDTITAQLHTDRMAAAAYERRKASYAELEYLRARKQKSSKAQSIAMPCPDEEEEFDAPANADVASGNNGKPRDGSAKPSNRR